MDPLRRPATDAEAKALASSLRLQILRLCLHQPRTNRELAAHLERPGASVLHHVRTLLAVGFLEAGEERRGARNAREIPYRATGRSWNIALPAGLVDRPAIEAFLAETAHAPTDEITVTRLGLHLDPAARDELTQRLTALLDEYRHRSPSDTSTEAVSVLLALHSAPLP